MMGVYFNLSFWYKVTDRTIWGAVFSGAGCAVLIAVNLIFIPKIGYMACAWGGFAGYGVAMLMSYFVGKKYYPVAYPLKDIFLYVLLAGVLYAGMILSSRYLGAVPRLAVNTVLILAFVFYILRKDLPVRSLPVIGKYFR